MEEEAMKHIRVGLISIIILLVLSACAVGAATQSPNMEAPLVDMGERNYAPMESKAMDQAAGEGLSQPSSTGNMAAPGSPAVERIVIKNASLTIVVQDPARIMELVTKMADEMGGFVVNSNLYKIYSADGVEIPEATITVRVPAEKLTNAMEQIKAQVANPKTDILTENVTGQDVTQEYTDLTSRLTNLENAAVQLNRFMEDAETTTDVLNVYNQLVYTQEQIEVLKGQINYYDEASRLSSIALTIRSQEATKPVTIGKWTPGGVAQKAVQALVDMLKFIASVLIWLVIFVAPLLLLGYLPIRIIWGIIRKRNAAKKAVQTQKPE
jgi:hypothetical protein